MIFIIFPPHFTVPYCECDLSIKTPRALALGKYYKRIIVLLCRNCEKTVLSLRFTGGILFYMDISMIYTYAFYFFIYAFLGWCTEVTYAALETGTFVNRGFLNGPVCPIYGCGMCIVITLLTPLSANLFFLFAGAMALTTGLEWLTGFLMEKLFHERWWDYTDEHFNVGGYICLKFSLLWGFGCVFVMRIIQPIVAFGISLLPVTAGTVLLIACSAGMIADLSVTSATVAGLNKRIRAVDSLSKSIRKVSDGIGTLVSGDALLVTKAMSENGALFTEQSEADKAALAEKKESVVSAASAIAEKKDDVTGALAEKLAAQSELFSMKLTLGQRRIMRAFPKMRSIPYKEAFETLRRKLPGKKKDDEDGRAA